MSAAADMGSVYQKAPAAPPGVTWGDWIEIAGTYVVLALVASIAVGLLRGRTGSFSRRAGALSFLLLFLGFTTYALGRGMHVAANSIHDSMGAAGGASTMLAYFWDEHAGHAPVDVARILFAVALCALEAGTRAPGSAPRRDGVGVLPWLGSVAYGFIYFATAIEGQTVFLALPFSAALATWGIFERRSGRSSGTVARFYTTAAVVSLLFFLFYGIWQRGFPEFTRAGIL